LRLYNLSRPFEGLSLSSLDLRCLPRVVGNVIGDRVPLEELSSTLPARAIVTGGQLL
jgi:hypothetical protein